MYAYIEKRFNDIILSLSESNAESIQTLAQYFNCELSFYPFESCYIFQKVTSKCKIIINNTKSESLQYKEFFHELSHHLLHSTHTFENEYQAQIAYLFLLIPRDTLRTQISTSNLSNDEISELADFYNVSEAEMYLRLFHFFQNNIFHLR